MKNEFTPRRLPDDPCIDEETMLRYIDGKLPAADMYVVELHTLDCDMCADALEGLQQVKDRERVAAYLPSQGNVAGPSMVPEAKIIPIKSNRLFYYSAAACAALIIGFFTLKNTITNSDKAESKLAENSITQNDASNSPVNASPSGTAANTISIQNDSLKTDLSKEQESSTAFSRTSSASGSSAGPAERRDEIVLSKEATRSEDITPGFFDQMEPNDDIPKNEVGDLKNANDEEVANQSPEKTDVILASTESVSTAGKPDKKGKDKEGNRSDQNRASVPAAPKSSSGAGVSANDGLSRANSNGTKDVILEDNSNVVVDGDHQVSADTTVVFHPLKASDKDIQLSYSKGVEELQKKNAALAILFFDDVLKYPLNSNYQDAQWKKTEALLLLEKKEEAKILLNEIIAGGGKYKDQAVAKLKTL